MEKKGRLLGYSIAVAALGSIAASSFVIAPTTAVRPSHVPTVLTYPRSIHATLGTGGGPVPAISMWGAQTDNVVAAPSLAAKQSSHQSSDCDPSHDKSVLEKATEKVKSLLPGRFWAKDDETRKGELERRRERMELRREMKQTFRGAPFPIRVVGNMITSRVGNAMGKEGRKVEVLLRDAQRLIGADEAVWAALGEPIMTGRVFSQSSSTATVNGKKSMKVEASFEVHGSRKSGVAMMVANKYQKGGITALRVRVGGRSYGIGVDS